MKGGNSTLKTNLPPVNSYLKNLGRSIKYVAVNEIRETIPIVFEARETNEEAINTIRSTFRSKNKINTISKIAKESDFFKSGKEVFKNLKSSIKTGTFYSKARDDKASEEFFNEMTRGDDEEGFGDFNMDEDLNADDSEESLNQSADALNDLNEDLNAGFEANATAISNTTVESARYIGETIKGSAAMAYAQNSEQTFLMKSGFKSLDDGLKKLINFNADSLQKHIQNSTSFFDNTSKLLSEQNAMIKEMLEMQRNVYKNEQDKEKKKDPTFNKYASIVSSSGVVNLSDYFKNIKENTAEYLEPVNMILNMIKANPMEAVLQGMLSFIGSDSMKHAGENLNKTLSGAFGKYLSFLEKQAKKNGGIWSTLNDIFGIKNREKREVDTGNFQKGPMQFNGIANKAITEVIPGYLARIEAALTGEDERYFNFSNGRWTNAKKIRKEYAKKANAASEATGLSELLGEMRYSLSKVDYNNYAGVKIKSKDKKELFNNIMQQIVNNNGDIDDSFILRDTSGNGHNKIDKKAFYKIFGFDKNSLTKSQIAMLDILATALANTNESTRASLNNTVRQAKGARSEFLWNIEQDPTSIYKILLNNQLSGSRSVKYAVPYGEGSAVQPGSFEQGKALLDILKNSGTQVAGVHQKGKKDSKKDDTKDIDKLQKKIKELQKQVDEAKKGSKEQLEIESNLANAQTKLSDALEQKEKKSNISAKPINSNKNEPFDYAKQVFTTISTADEFIDLHDASVQPVIKKFIGYVSGLTDHDINKLNTSDKPVQDFLDVVKDLVSGDFSNDCKVYSEFIDYVQASDSKATINIKSAQFRKLPVVARNFFYFIDGLVSKQTISTSEALAQSMYDNNTYKAEYGYDEYQGNGLWDKLEKAKGIDKLGVLMGYTKKLTSMPFDILGGVIAKTDKIIYDIFFGKQQVTSGGAKVTGFFELLTTKIGDAVENLYKEVKNRIWSDDQWNMYKDTIYSNLKTVGKFFGNTDDIKKSEKENTIVNPTDKAERAKLAEEYVAKHNQEIEEKIKNNDILDPKERLSKKELKKLKKRMITDKQKELFLDYLEAYYGDVPLEAIYRDEAGNVTNSFNAFDDAYDKIMKGSINRAELRAKLAELRIKPENVGITNNYDFKKSPEDLKPGEMPDNLKNLSNGNNVAANSNLLDPSIKLERSISPHHDTLPNKYKQFLKDKINENTFNPIGLKNPIYETQKQASTEAPYQSLALDKTPGYGITMMPRLDEDVIPANNLFVNNGALKTPYNTSIDGAAYGLGMVPKTDLYTLHKGEAVIPAYLNPAYKGNDVDPAKHAKDEQAVARKYGLTVKGYAEGTVEKKDNTKETKEKEKAKQSMFSWLKKTYPAMLGEGTLGAVLGTVVAGPLGLMGGAMLGAANYVLKNSEEANKFLFGDEQKKSLFARTKSGLKKVLPKSITSFFENQEAKLGNLGKYTAMGGGLGLIAGAIGGPFGLMGGLVLGAGAGLLKNYEGARKLVFGNHDVKGKIDKVLSKKYLKSIGLGALGGGIMFGPLGILGGAMLGVAGQYASDSDKFKDWMFGAKDPNTGERKYSEGFLGKVGEKILSPLSTLKDDIVHYMDEAVFQPISRAFVPLTRYTQLGMRGLFKKVTKAFDAIINPSLRMPWYKNLPAILRGPAGRFVKYGLAGAAAGAMFGPFGGLVGAGLGGLLGTGLAVKYNGKTLGSWFGKGLAKIGKAPGKALDMVTNRLNKKLIANGNMDSLSMSASERLDFMSRHNYAYNSKNGHLHEQNDYALADASIGELQAMQSTISIMNSLNQNPDRHEIEGKIRDAVKAIPGLSFGDQKRIMKIVRGIAEGQTGDKDKDSKIITNGKKIIKKLILEYGFTEEQVEKFMKPIELGISALAVNDNQQELYKSVISDKSKFLKDNFGYSVVDGDLEKATEQVDTEIKARINKGEKPDESLLTAGERAITQGNEKIVTEISESNLYLKAIKEFMEEGKISEETQQAIDKRASLNGLVNVGRHQKLIAGYMKTIDKLEAIKKKNNGVLTEAQQREYEDAQIGIANSQKWIQNAKENDEIKAMTDAFTGTVSAGVNDANAYGDGNIKGSYDTLTSEKFFNVGNISEKQFHDIYIKGKLATRKSSGFGIAKALEWTDNGFNAMRKVFKNSPAIIQKFFSLSPEAINPDTIYILMDAFEKCHINIDPSKGGEDNFDTLIKISKQVYESRIKSLSEKGFKFTNISEILNLSDADFSLLSKIFKENASKLNGVGVTKNQDFWIGLVNKINNGEIAERDVYNSANYMANKQTLAYSEDEDSKQGYIGKMLNRARYANTRWQVNSFEKRNAVNIFDEKPEEDKQVKGYAMGTTNVPETGKYMVHKGEAVVSANMNDFNNLFPNRDLIQVYSDSAQAILTFRKTSDGGWSLDSGNKDSKEGMEKSDDQRSAILSLGEYAKLKLKDAASNLKKKGAGLWNAVKNSGIGSLFGSLKSLFGTMFGGIFGIGDAIAKFIPGYSLLKGKLFRGVGNTLGGWASKLGDKASALSKTGKLGKVGGFLGKVGGKVLGGASFLLKNMADAASAAADAEESTPEFQTELEALHYVARKISGVEAAVVAGAQQAADATGLTNMLPDKLKPSATPTIDPKTGKPVVDPKGGKPGFFSNMYSKAKNAMSAVGTKAMAAVGPVVGFVQNGLKRVFDIASKFLPSSLGQKISSFSSAIIKKVSDPKVAIKVSEKAAKKGLQLGLGPIGWAILAGSIAVSFYQGYNNAETIWNDGNENKETDLSMGEKAICGVCSVVANELLLGIFTPSEILNTARSIFGKIAGITDTIKETASNAMNSISQYTDKLLNAGKEMWNNIKTSMGKGWDNIKDSVTNAVQGLKDTFDKFKAIGFDTVVDILKKPIDWIKDAAKSLMGESSSSSTTTTNKTYQTVTPTTPAVPADTSKPTLDWDAIDRGISISTGLASNAINYGKPDLNADPDKGIGTKSVDSILNEYRATKANSWKERYANAGKKKGTGGPLPHDSLLRLRLGIGGGDMTPEAIWNILTTKYHYSNQAAAAIMGSMQQESSFNPLASQHGGGIEASIAQGEGTNGFGLCQWTGSRTQALVDFCKSNSLDPLTAEGQIAFMNYEMGQRGSNAAFNSASTVDDALLVMKKYEGYGEVGQREDYARQIFQNQGKGLASAGSAISGGTIGSSKAGAKFDNSLFGRIDQAFEKAFSPFTSIFGNLFGGSNSSSSNNSSSSSSSTTSGNIGVAATDMSGDIDAGSTAEKLIANLKSSAGNASDVEVTAPYAEENHFGHTHGGIDIAAPEGTPIKSPVAGTVVDNSFGGGYGHFVQIKDKNNMDHLFPHMVSPSPLPNGTQVNPGDVVGYVGSTGNSTGPHVHYEIDDHAVNPGAMSSLPHINPGKYVGGPLPGDSTLKFRKKVNELANAGNKAAIKALKKGYGSDNIGKGGPTPNDDLRNYSNSGLEGKDYSDQFNQIIQLLSVIASAVQSQAAVSATSANNAPVNTGTALSSTTPNASLINIIKSMTTIANH